MRKRSGLSGFTLLELTVAAALLVVLGGAVTILFGRGLTAWQRADGRLEQIFVIEKGLERFGRELRNAIVIADLPWAASKDAVTFSTAESPTEIGIVSYRVVASTTGTPELIREWQAYPKDQETVKTTIASNVSNFSLEYASIDEKDGQKRIAWLSTWDMSKQLNHTPKLVRIRMETTDPKGRAYGMTRQLWIPSGVFGSQEK